MLSRFSDKLAEEEVDIVCLMEVFQDSRTTFMNGLAHKLVLAANLKASYYQMVTEPTEPAYGNLIISRWPIEQPTFIPLVNFANKPEWGALVATLRTPHGPIYCLISTLAWGYRKQFYQLRQLLTHPYIKYIVEHQFPCLWIGGFRDSLNLQSSGIMYRQQWKSAISLRGQINTWPAWMPIWSPDKVYFKGPLNPILCKPESYFFSPAISCHLPTISQFEFTRS
jgi:endonuclease/exonuclease/phosphatase family metal-dependent hydrolase